jgi:transposase
LFLSISLHSIGFPSTLQILDQIDHDTRRVTLRAQTTVPTASCPACGIPSRRVHGAYWRSLGDVACFGRPTLLLVRIRRFRCTSPECPQRTFAEPLPGVARPRARQTDRLRSVHRAIGLVLGGNPGARHAATMGVPISRTTLLHRIRAGDAGPIPPVRVLGVDDWAWRKGHNYGTILCDLERRRVIDLLPDRSADTLAAWLMEHPSVSAVVRDRAGAYAEGAARGAPDAIQIADRWHLLRNGSDALRTVLDQHNGDLCAAARTVAHLPELSAPEEPAIPEPAAPSEPERPMRSTERRAAQERRDARFAEAARLREQGLSLKAIARTIGVERKTVRRWLRAGHAPTWPCPDMASRRSRHQHPRPVPSLPGGALAGRESQRRRPLARSQGARLSRAVHGCSGLGDTAPAAGSTGRTEGGSPQTGVRQDLGAANTAPGGPPSDR